MAAPGWCRDAFVLGVVLAAAGLCLTAGETGGEPDLPSSSVPGILESIRTLESARDAKCYATASRLEDFLYGTPLSDAARFRKADLQKALIRGLWAEASTAARARGAEELAAADVQPLLDRALPRNAEGDGPVVVRLGARTVTLERRDVEHYSSVAYALRALLGVQQDALLRGDADLLRAGGGAIDAMRRFLDLYTLTALSLADRAARLADEPVISEERLVASWGEVGAAAGSRVADPPPVSPAAAAGRRPDVLRAITEAKLASYAAYNEMQDDPRLLFRANMQHYFVRYPLPDSMPGVEDLESRLERRLDEFVRAELRLAEASARAAGRGLLRAADADHAVQRLTPHRMNRFEDAIFFPRLPRDEQVTLEAYDMDSFRDFGRHWSPIARALGDPEFALGLEPDPFAAELLAEGIAQYGVLLLRLAGDLARAETLPTVRPEHLERAAEVVADRARRNAAAPAPDAEAPRLVSAPAASAGAAGTFFTDVTGEAKLAYEHRSADWLDRFRRDVVISPPSFSGGGIASEDVNGDDRPDLLLVGGGGNALLLNDGSGRFVDGTAQAGIDFVDADGHPAEARQPLIVDFDNDGRQDILITYVNADHRLHRGLGGGRFEDVSSGAGLGGRGLIGGPATAFDHDGDGLLDLYLGYFGDYLGGSLPKVARDNQNAQPNRLFRNLGGMRFQDVTEGSGADDRGWTQAVSHTDFDLDGRQDIIVANDYGRSAYLRNLGGGRFANLAAELGTDEPAHSMNVGIADLNWDNHPDIYISNIVAMVKDDRYVLPNEGTDLHFDKRAMARMRIVESNALYVSRVRDGALTYVRSGAITRGASSTGWAWDADFFDFDNDGDDDLYVVNGTNDYFIFGETRYLLKDGELAAFPYAYNRESNVFFVNEGDELRNESAKSGADFVGASRSTAYLDYDGDGDLDVAVNNFHSPAVMLRNNAEARGNRWLKVRLVGDPSRGSTRDAIGARLVLRTAEGGRVWREVHGGTGYLSMDPKQQHFGLGRSASADLWIRWPDGEEQILRGLPADTAQVIVQGQEPAGPRAAGR